MATFRFIALEKTLGRKVEAVHYPSKVSDYYGSMTFNQSVMHEYLTEEAYRAVMNAIETGESIDRKITDQVASAMKAWAMEKGATHYTHWFHPLTGSTAEKHDAFINPLSNGKALEHFQGSQLIQQEPDASSFPSGGIRSTFEARGYTAWDPTSPAFILDHTLCIPTIFVSYTGESLDYKTPLLKSMAALDTAATEVCRYFDKSITKVYPTLGWEQEYFLVDEALYAARPDLVLTGKTVFGHASAKDQQLSDHYFGTINDRALAFMQDLEIESHKLGIPLKTRHNEVAPSQFECAPMFEEVNVAVDHNQLLMHMLEKVARKHHFRVLLHEKPYAGINGSGKHNNWSMATNTGVNLLAPGKTSKDNFRFITILANILMAVRDYEELLRASVASEGNDLRLGANEAPPAIISVFLGRQITKTLDEIEQLPEYKELNGHNGRHVIKNIPKIPEILLDNTDRNRTSPFAFTGNKFEFRAVGSSANTAKPMFVLNTIVAEQMTKFKAEVDALMEKGMLKDAAIFNVVKSYIQASKAIRFEGNSYSSEWVEEAAKRGLSNNRNTPDALPEFISEKSVALFEKHNVLSRKELLARNEIKLEKYIKKIQIEARVLGDLAVNHILPTAIQYQNRLIENAKGLKEILDAKSFQQLSKNEVSTIKEISDHVAGIKEGVSEMVEARKKANAIENTLEKAVAYRDTVLSRFEDIRRHVDKLELLVDDNLWPLPKYRELLFIK
ncbi:glutamine synthetase III [Candidatus Sulfidibacterium hydrothermale]|uniref:glutamine synthetase III family protein n=1 Tax=Candidatus Sulfidibacterium hydrothermale TaxID=2875962 RepID=UPI001F0A7AE0|nr:glutamine synthetase III [Candidatus Sulfidibacterium hydrothermale]UBM61929.1 glutamine synthetase III [Candidatus Sulfidibacterium hydrothermale]